MPTKPHAAEVLLAELMASTLPLDGQWLMARCVKESDDPTVMVRDLHALGDAGLIECTLDGFQMTPEGRALLRTRPPFDCSRAILAHLAAMGPCTSDELRHACRQQAQDYSDLNFNAALTRMVRDDCTVADVTEEGDEESSYDLPN